MRARAAGLVVVALALAGCSQSAPVARGGDPVEPRATPAWALSGALSGAASPAPRPRATPARPRVVAQAVSPSRLLGYDGCSDLLARVKREALSEVGPYGLQESGFLAFASRGGPVPAAAARDAGAPAAAPAYSGTNNQEAGVDEADLVKTDGRLMLVLRRAPLGVQVLDVTGDVPRLRGFLPLPTSLYDGQLLLVDGRAVVVGSSQGPEADRYQPRTEVVVVSLADPAAPAVERRFTLEGSLSAAREVDGRVLLVTQSSPDVAWSYPKDDTAAERRRALERNRQVIRSSTLDTWLPSVRSSGTGRLYRASCGDAMHSQAPSGTQTTAVVSIDPASDVPGHQVTVAGSSSVVYASPQAVYVTTWPWSDQQAASTRPVDERDVATDVHRFDITDRAVPRYTGSGSVRGTLIGQYAMSEHEGHLRVASTVGRTWAMQDEEEPPSDNLVTVLRPTAEELVTVGRVSGLGRGERIYGVRFLGDLGYVVTFRQTDPLYVLDLSDPVRPTRRGELHVTGYSSYLHPLGPGLLLGIGQEVDQNRTQGTQVSTFDVSDDAAPRLRSRDVFEGGWSAAEHDPHSVLWWPQTRTVVVPLTQQASGTTQQPPFEGVVVLGVTAGGALRERGRVSHPEDTPEGSRSPECCWGGILRSVVIGDSLLTLSERGVLTVALDTLEVRSWSPYR